MQTISSSKLARDQTSNPTSSTNPTPKGRIRRSSKQKVENSHFEERLTPVATMTDNRTMAEMLRAPTEGCAEAIIVPPILAEQFELKHSLINMMTSEQFFRLKKDNPHDHVRASRRWLEKEPPRSITTWDDLVSKFINEFFPPSELAKLTHAVNQQTSDVTTAMTAMHKQFQSNPPPAQVKAVEEICVTCGEMILRDGDERLTLNMKHDTASYSNHHRRESVNLINIFNLSREDCLEDLVSNKQSGNPTFSLHKEIASPEVIPEFHDSKGCTFLSEELPDIDSFNDIHPHFNDDPLSGSTTFSANSLLDEFTDELALISYPSDYDDNLTCDIESDIKEIEF
nr:hypothetical protein [Tanacetum cinerariifolium]